MREEVRPDRTEPGEGASDSPGVRKAWPWWIAAMLWMGAIFVLSAQPDFTFVPLDWQTQAVSLLAHAVEYAILAGLWFMAASRTPALAGRWQGLSRPAVLALGVALLYALSDEFHQSFVPGRSADPVDLLADMAGAVIVVWILQRRQTSRAGL